MFRIAALSFGATGIAIIAAVYAALPWVASRVTANLIGEEQQ